MDRDAFSIFAKVIQELSLSSSEEELFRHLALAVRSLEFDFFAHGARVAYPVTRPTFFLKNNYPTNWQRCYIENNYLAIDPTVAHGLSTTRPILWSDESMHQQDEFWEEASVNGLKYGWAQSSTLNPSTTGMLTVARNNERINTQELSLKQPLLLWLNDAFQSAYAEIVLPRIAPQPKPDLSSREIEVLKWCSDGKTSDKIAVIFHVKKRTVDFHVANAIEKLNVTNKTAAAVRAVQLNIL